uniref:Cytochrome P450 n=1 Tax=Glossina pallidipes TaxID=7398 RepID=A0A1A9ZGA2_GLOPL
MHSYKTCAFTLAKPNTATTTMAVAIAIRLQTTLSLIKQQTPIAIGAERLGSETNKVEESQTTKMASNSKGTAASMSRVRSYCEVPGPWGIPIIGNSWRFAPFIGHYKISKLDKVMKELHTNYGKIAKIGGLIGHPDLLFIFDGDEIRKIFKKEETMPHRPSMPCLKHYKGQLRKDFFGDVAGLIGVHGKNWELFRQEVQQILLQPQIAKKYVSPLNGIATEFMAR